MSRAAVRRSCLLLLPLALLMAGPCVAGGPPPASLTAGYGRALGDENRPVEPSTRDANNNRVIINGMLGDPSGLAGGLNGGLSGGLGDGQGLGYSGVGRISAQAVANQINVVAAGSWNTIVIDAVQTNTGAVQASAALNSAKVTDDAR
jgi:holdfast attachment protein HfaA